MEIFVSILAFSFVCVFCFAAFKAMNITDTSNRKIALNNWYAINRYMEILVAAAWILGIGFICFMALQAVYMINKQDKNQKIALGN